MSHQSWKKTRQNLASLLNQGFVQELTCVDNYIHKSCFLLNCDEQKVLKIKAFHWLLLKPNVWIELRNTFLWPVLYTETNQLGIVRSQLFCITIFHWLTCVFNDPTACQERLFYLYKLVSLSKNYNWFVMSVEA